MEMDSDSTTPATYPIGTPGQAWGDAEKREWFEQRSIERSYGDEVLAKITALAQQGDICLLYTSPSPRDRTRSRMPSSA